MIEHQSNKVISFTIDRAWKGVPEDRSDVPLITSQDSVSCGYPFEIGKSYLVYAHAKSEDDSSFSVSLCSSTKPIEQAGADLAILEGSYVPSQIILGFPFYLSINQSAASPEEDIQTRFVNVTEDSRCPIDVQCIWAGQVSVLVEVSRMSDGHVLGEFILTDNGKGVSKNIDGYTIELGHIEPAKVSTQEIELTDYLVQFIIQRTDDAKPDTVYPSNPVATDEEGRTMLKTLEVGQEVNVAITIHNNFDKDIQYLAILEVRSPDSVTQFLGFPYGVLQSNSWADLGIGPWTPSEPGKYQLRTFLLSNSNSPEIMSQRKISVIEVK